jgi:hypothetical protein
MHATGKMMYSPTQSVENVIRLQQQLFLVCVEMLAKVC